jgi:serine/threonine-protein kinase
VIGRGGSAVVYEAYNCSTGQKVALKVLSVSCERDDDKAVARLEREARAALMIRHPNVCSTYDFGRLADGRSFVAMELLQGETLRTILERQHHLDPETAIEIMVQVLLGLEAAHSVGVIHRDMKPENVFIDGGNRIKVLDFGICRWLRDPLGDRSLTATGCIVGTPGYFAPEQAYGDRCIDLRADLFAVGIMLYEALAGRRAYERLGTRELSIALARRIPALHDRSFSPVFDPIIRRATDPEPRLRYESAALFQHDLLEARTAMRRAARLTG